jgi:hypothetical protein
MQVILVTIFVVAAIAYLAKLGYSHFFSKKTKCDGCAIHKIYSDQKG